ncbi:retinol-binding protein pinta [Condylostylus longicornis]|uniref:retinol-binding protein pinta n=1 Tax=Condylostylus longicornis TaxID=2530218 RepID=UPI00244DC398|nr:retinol-binding protein pinta [Condylostylus longicornis]
MIDENLDMSPEEVLQMKEIKEWIKENHNLKVKASDDLNILYFIRSAKNDCCRAKMKIEKFSKMRRDCKEWFSNRNPFLPEMQELFKIGVFLPIQSKPNEPFIVVIRTAAHDPSKHVFDNVLKCSKMILDLLMRLEPTISKTGVVAILDMKGVSFGHALQLTPNVIKKLVSSMESYPIKVKLLEFVHCPPHINFILNTFRLFMSQKMKSRLVVRVSSSEVEADLPSNLGGKGSSYQEIASNWKKIVENNSSFYEGND